MSQNIPSLKWHQESSPFHLETIIVMQITCFSQRDAYVNADYAESEL